MWDIIVNLAAVSLLAAVVIVGMFLMRAHLDGVAPREAIQGLFAQGSEQRLAVMETARIDSRRRLVLIRRDDVEHLVMIGGPVDLVIETGISRPGPSEGNRTTRA